MFIFQAIACLWSGVLTNALGRKHTMAIVNIPHLLAWLTLCYARSVPEIFVGSSLLGIGNGLALSPTITYIGEIAYVAFRFVPNAFYFTFIWDFFGSCSEPSIRGIMTGLSMASCNAGMIAIIVLGSHMTLRQTALTCAIVPIVVLALVLIVSDIRLFEVGEEQRIIIFRSFQDSRITALVAVQTPSRRSTAIIVLATRLGTPANCCHRIRTTAALHSAGKCLFDMRQKRCSVCSFSAVVTGKNTGFVPSACAKAIAVDVDLLDLLATVWVDGDATVFGVDSGCVRCTDGRPLGGGESFHPI